MAHRFFVRRRGADSAYRSERLCRKPNIDGIERRLGRPPANIREKCVEKKIADAQVARALGRVSLEFMEAIFTKK